MPVSSSDRRCAAPTRNVPLGCYVTGSAIVKHTLSSGQLYGSFTEGFATPDLREAKALLDELSDQLDMNV